MDNEYTGTNMKIASHFATSPASTQPPLLYRITNLGMIASAEETNTCSSSLNDLTTIGDLDAFEPVAGMFTSHANITLYGEVTEDVANLSAIDGSKYEYIPFP